MTGIDWLAEQRMEMAAERILDAAEQLFAEQDPAAVGMNEIASAAGCSRATLYRYFENREALRTAYVHRESHRLYQAIEQQIRDVDTPRERLVAGLTTTLRLVRNSPAMASWFKAGRAPIGATIADRSEVIKALSAAFVGSLGADDDSATVQRRARWLVRVLTSLLLFPADDEAEERAMIEDFVAPILTPGER